MITTVVNIHHGVEYDVYIGRPGRGLAGPLGNPIVAEKPCVECGEKHGRDYNLLACYRRWLWRRIRQDQEYRILVRACYGKRLGCFCVRADGTGACHGHILARAAEWLADQERPL